MCKIIKENWVSGLNQLSAKKSYLKRVSQVRILYSPPRPMLELLYRFDLGSNVERIEGWNPSRPTNIITSLAQLVQ